MSAKTDVVVKMASVFFLALFSFAVGTFVGKKYSDNQHQLAAMEPSGSKSHGESHGDAHGDSQAGGHASASHDEGKGGGESAKEMTDEEVAKLGAETLEDEKPAAHGDTTHADAGHGEPAHGEAAADAHGKSAEHAPAKKDEHAQAKNAHESAPANAHVEANDHAAPAAAHDKPMVASTAGGKKNEHGGNSHGEASHSEAPAKMKKADAKAAQHKNADANSHADAGASASGHGESGHGDREPASLSKDTFGDIAGKFTVQVGAYPNVEEAKKTVESLIHDGYTAIYTPAEVKGKTWYRVGIGPFATEGEAKKEQEKMKGNSRFPASFVKKISR